MQLTHVPKGDNVTFSTADKNGPGLAFLFFHPQAKGEFFKTSLAFFFGKVVTIS